MITCKLHHIEQITADIYTFWFTPDKPLDYTAGQFIELTLPHEAADSRGIKRWFTLSSSPTEPLLGITTKLAEQPSSFMKSLFSLQPGEVVNFSAAMGDFVVPINKTIPLLFVVGGIGITPLRSMLQWLKDSNQKRHIEVLFTAKTAADLAFLPLLNSQASIKHFVNNQKLTSQDVLAVANTQPNSLIYISGPEKFVEQLVTELQAADIAMSRLVTDYFPGYSEL